MSGAQALFAALALAVLLGSLTWVLAPLASSRRLAKGVAVTLPLACVALYFALGTPKALDAAGRPPPHSQAAGDLQARVERLHARLQAQPGDLEGWFMLARSYQALQQWDRAAAAYREAIALAPDDAGLLADLADVLAELAEGEFEGEPRQLLQRALAAEPGHPKTLLLLAAADFRQGRLAQASAHWETLLRAAPADSQAAGIARQGLERVRQLAGQAVPAGGNASAGAGSPPPPR